MSAKQLDSPIDWSLDKLRHDHLARLLLENSHLTEVQFATLLIDVFWTSGKPLPEDGRLMLRSTLRKVSKGAFNRSLSQARQNVVRSIYTVFLLAYFGMFDSPKLEPFLRLGDEMKTFLDTEHETRAAQDKEVRDATKALEDALYVAVGELAGTRRLKQEQHAT